MKRWRFLLVLAALLVGVILFATFGGGPAEPVYQGRKLSEWIEEAASNPSGLFNTNGFLALRAIGNNAIPWLLAELDARDGPLKRKINDFAQRRKWEFHLESSVDVRQRRAAKAFCCLGPQARGAIPQLVERLGKDRAISRYTIEVALAGIAKRETEYTASDTWLGPPLARPDTDEDTADLPAIRREIIDRLRPVAAEADLDRRLIAIRVLMVITRDTADAVPILLHALQSTNEFERILSAQCLGAVAKEPVPVIPPLIAALDDPSPNVQASAARALGNYFRQARTAVPALRKLSTNGVPRVQRAAQDALLKIDPEGTAEAFLRRTP